MYDTFFFDTSSQYIMWSLQAHHLEGQHVSRQRKPIFPVTGSTLGCNEILGLDWDSFVISLDMPHAHHRCKRRRASAEGWVVHSDLGLEVITFFGRARLSGRAAGEQFAEPAAFGTLQRKPNTSHIRSQ